MSESLNTPSAENVFRAYSDLLVLWDWVLRKEVSLDFVGLDDCLREIQLKHGVPNAGFLDANTITRQAAQDSMDDPGYVAKYEAI
ncbi:MAG: hypothetical protein WDN27_00255 [Candidatus Saccharibacteria bacterium]